MVSTVSTFNKRVIGVQPISGKKEPPPPFSSISGVTVASRAHMVCRLALKRQRFGTNGVLLSSKSNKRRFHWHTRLTECWDRGNVARTGTKALSFAKLARAKDQGWQILGAALPEDEPQGPQRHSSAHAPDWFGLVTAFGVKLNSKCEAEATVLHIPCLCRL